jgi:hypothetical protein
MNSQHSSIKKGENTGKRLLYTALTDVAQEYRFTRIASF